jgi:hypothetical protein
MIEYLLHEDPDAVAWTAIAVTDRLQTTLGAGLREC